MPPPWKYLLIIIEGTKRTNEHAESLGAKCCGREQ